MLERWITAAHTEDAGTSSPAEIRERLKERFPRNASRRMTPLGLVLGSTLAGIRVEEDDALVYASVYGETGTLEGYLDSFPTPSPTLFQSSIHPSSVQQNLILGQQPLDRFFPVTGSEHTICVQSLEVALLCPNSRVLLCCGEELGGWLLEHGRASDRTFAFTLALSTSPTGAVGRIRLDDAGAGAAPVPLPLATLFDLVRCRRAFSAVVPPGRQVTIEWS